ncbi:MAG: hypothetical protein H7123_01890, partial [Thermoleophilia bacterium]|nr:hypothetical protein [Thermoleophilia bacterium]
MATFVRQFSMAPDDERRMAVRPTHREYVAELFARGEIRMSGPFADNTGACMVYEVASEAAARELIAADPYTIEGVVTE